MHVLLDQLLRFLGALGLALALSARPRSFALDTTVVDSSVAHPDDRSRR
jgi:hypothetical protein